MPTTKHEVVVRERKELEETVVVTYAATPGLPWFAVELGNELRLPLYFREDTGLVDSLMALTAEVLVNNAQEWYPGLVARGTFELGTAMIPEQTGSEKMVEIECWRCTKLDGWGIRLPIRFFDDERADGKSPHWYRYEDRLGVDMLRDTGHYDAERLAAMTALKIETDEKAGISYIGKHPFEP